MITEITVNVQFSGLARSSWSCYFLPETSADCQKHALDLMQSKDSRENGIIKVKENYTSKQIWAGHIPRYHFDALVLFLES